MPREELFKIYLKIHWKSVMCSVWNLFGNQFENRFENTLENLHANMFGNPFRNTFQNSFRYSFRFFSEVIRKLFGWDNVITWRRRSRRCSSIRNILCTYIFSGVGSFHLADLSINPRRHLSASCTPGRRWEYQAGMQKSMLLLYKQLRNY